MPQTKEEIRLAESRERNRHWKRWGPYVSERAWGTVREDYSASGDAWEFFPHEHARSRVYRWNEDGIAGICDRHQLICFAIALWNERDSILKERLFGLTGYQGNHGEDVKEYYFYLDSTPTHSYMKFLYKYPQTAYPYTQLVDENGRRGKNDPEYELLDTGAFKDDRYFDILVEYAKGDVDDIVIKITATNRGPATARLRLLPTIWFRNTWSWENEQPQPPSLYHVPGAIELDHQEYGKRWLFYEGAPELLFTENETNNQRLFGTKNRTAWVKDGINDYIVNGIKNAVSSEARGTKASAHYALEIASGESATIRLRLTNINFLNADKNTFDDFARIFSLRKQEADEFYATIIPQDLSADAQNIMRQGFAGMLWSKQFYHYVIKQWLEGDPANPPPPAERLNGRNKDWPHLYNSDVISMPDKWEYPWYAAWDLAFHCVPLALVDPDFAKEQLTLLIREWYMHPNGQLPAYEWALGDVNPPVHAWAAWRVYKIDKKRSGTADYAFLERVFHKLLLNFTWWVNRKDTDGMNIFQGGFLGLDNIGVFDRSAPLPTGGYIEQSDGTSWMAMYTLNLLAIALELSSQNPAYEDVASKFWEHFIYIAHAMSHRGQDGVGLWDETDGFFYDVLKLPDGSKHPLRIRSMVGLIPLFAVQTLEPELLERLPGFKRRLEWFIDNRPDLVSNVACMRSAGMGERRLLSIVTAEQLPRILHTMLDESEFLSSYGIRALSRYHRDHPYILGVNGTEHRVDYEPAESVTGLFGGNSNWRGPIWFPMNLLIVESLQKFHHYFGDDFKVEFPTGSGKMLTLWQVSGELSRRLTSIFLRDEQGRRPVNGDIEKFQSDPHWRDLIQFHEYFHADNARGLGASHQTGWTGLVTKLFQQSGEHPKTRSRKAIGTVAHAD
ncbi:MAG: glucosidase [Acidobacteriaceae bacterium]|nr:glucosidase [Acidobacteriaceae bacterium]